MNNTKNYIKSPYSSAFTAGGVLFREFNAVLPLIFQNENVALLNREKLENKYLSINSEASRKRVLQEIIKRVQLVSNEFWNLYKNINESQQRLMLFFLCLESYTIIKTLHFEVTLPKWRTMNRSVDLFEYKMKLDEIAAIDADVDSWSESTKQKVLTVSIRMLNEAGFTKSKIFIRPNLSHELATYFIHHNTIWFLAACFLNEPERKVLIENYL
jgi:hypothetical protein